MNKRRGGYRPGSGRPATGRNYRCYTVTFTKEEAEHLERQAMELGMSVNRYVRNLVRKSGMYLEVKIDPSFVDDEVSEYRRK